MAMYVTMLFKVDFNTSYMFYNSMFTLNKLLLIKNDLEIKNVFIGDKIIFQLPMPVYILHHCLWSGILRFS